MTIRLHMKQKVLCMLIALFPVSVTARAEEVDHGALEALFGEPVTTSATGQPQRASEAPASMIIITADEIRRSGARDIPGILRHAGGVDILEWTASHTDVSVRGYNREFSPRLLVLIDGRQVYADFYGYTPWGALPVEMEAIRQIEIVKGPNTALFGFNAVAGVINIVTYDPLADDIDAAAVFGGTQGSVGGSAVATFRLNDDAAFRLTAGKRRIGEFDTPVPPQVGSAQIDTAHREAVSGDAVIRISDGVSIRFGASHVDARRHEFIPGLYLQDGLYKATSFEGGLTADTGAGLIEATVYTNKYELLGQSDAVDYGAFDFDNRVTVARLQDLFTLGAAHTFRVTAEYRRNKVGTSPVEGGRVFYDIYSLGGMWDWKISPTLSLTNAVRFDHLALGRKGATPFGFPFDNADWDRSFSTPSFNTGVVWRPSRRDAVRLLVGRGVQLPDLTSLGGLIIAGPTVFVTGDPSLDPAATTSYAVEWARDIEELNADFRAGVFYQKTDDFLNFVGGIAPAAPPLFFIVPAGVGESRAAGVELGLSGDAGEAWRWGVDYRFETIDDDFAPSLLGGAQTVNFEDTTPKHLVNARLGWSGGRWELDGFFRYQSRTGGPLYTADGMMTTFIRPVGAYASLDARIGYALTDNVTLAVSGRNLGAAAQAQTVGPKVERVVMGSLTIRY